MATRTSRTSERSYGQFCPIAAGLDVIGDRWTLLILRELSMGDRRFTDLRGALPGLAPNLLTERLRGLQAAGLVTMVELAPPAARTVYRLTEEGQRIEPVLRSVARFGSRYLDGEPSDAVDAKRAAFALLAPWRRRPETVIRARLITDDTSPGGTVDLDLEPTGMVVVDGGEHAERVDVTLQTTVADLAAARRTGEPLVGRLTGSAAARQVFLDQFRLRMARTVK